MEKIKVSAPGKIILFGEHAVVYGESAVAVAINKRLKMSAAIGESNSVNGYPLSKRHHSYIYTGINTFQLENNIEFTLKTNIPSAAGMGSSAAISVCTTLLLDTLKKQNMGTTTESFKDILKMPTLHEKRREMEGEIANGAFDNEYLTQGGASPLDTSVVTHGSGVVLRKEPGQNHLWKAHREDKTWHIHHMEIPDLSLVLGNTGIRGRTSEQVAKVGRFVKKRNFGREIISEIGELVEEGIRAVESNDIVKIGELMDENHKLLSILGISHPKLEKTIGAVRRHSLGAKLTGAGGGGSFIAITDTPEKAIRALERFNINVFELKLSKNGVLIE